MVHCWINVVSTLGANDWIRDKSNFCLRVADYLRFLRSQIFPTVLSSFSEHLGINFSHLIMETDRPKCYRIALWSLASQYVTKSTQHENKGV